MNWSEIEGMGGHVKTAAEITGAIAALWAVLKMFGISLFGGIRKVGSAIVEDVRWRWKMPQMVSQILERVDKMQQELTFNGGHSTKDVVTRWDGMNRHDFKMSARPVMMLTQDGRVFECSDAFCELVDVRGREEVMDLSYLNFIYVEDLAAFRSHWLECARERRSVRWRFRLRNSESEAAGLWDFIATVILDKPSGAEYSASLKPADDIAKKIVAENGWRC